MYLDVDIRWTGDYGGNIESYRITTPLGKESSFHVYLNDYYQGCLKKIDSTWKGYFNVRSKVGHSDIPTLSYIIENEIERLRLLHQAKANRAN